MNVHCASQHTADRQMGLIDGEGEKQETDMQEMFNNVWRRRLRVPSHDLLIVESAY